MNLLFRLLWMLLRARFRAPQDIMAESEITFRCWPTDLDVNMHMTNARYASIADLARVDLMIRSGAWARLRAAGLSPVLGSSTIRFRRSIRPFQKFTVTTRTVFWDDKWIYILHKTIVGKDVAAIAIVKTVFLGKDGRVPVDQVVALMGYTGPAPAASELTRKKAEMDALLTA